MTDLDLADALIAAQDERIEELEAEKRAQFDECVATSTAYRERAEQAEAALAAMTEERDAAIMRNGAFVLSAQAEAENERLRWMLIEASLLRDQYVFPYQDSFLEELEFRWTRREEP